MKITFLLNGKTEDEYVEQGCRIYESRLSRYILYRRVELASPKVPSGTPPEGIRVREAEILLRQLTDEDVVILLDEKGSSFTSKEFARFLQQKLNSGIKSLVFVVGGPFGFDERIYRRSQAQISLSPMTFPHQLVRIIFAEQLYRAFSILRNEPYHHS